MIITQRHIRLVRVLSDDESMRPIILGVGQSLHALPGVAYGIFEELRDEGWHPPPDTFDVRFSSIGQIRETSRR